MELIKKLLTPSPEKLLKPLYKLADAIDALEPEYEKLSDAQLRQKTEELKGRAQGGESLDDLLVEAFAVVREGSKRVLGLRPFKVQMIGGIVLHQGRIAEMKTGEGKTLTAAMPAYLNALSGKGVHIVTVNDYLAQFQGEEMGKLYRFLGMSVGIILTGMTPEQRQAAYNCDITYATNNELGFDYLRDNMVVYKQNMVQRGHHFAIVDEVDSILIDEARTPLIISGAGEKSTDMYERADRFVCTLTEGVEPEEDRKALLAKLDEVFAADRCRVRVYGISQLGLVEMTRKRARADLRSVLTRPCPMCGTSARVLKEDALALMLKRFIRKIFMSGRAQAVLIDAHESVAAYVAEVYLSAWEEAFGRRIFLRGQSSMPLEKFRLDLQGSLNSVEARVTLLRSRGDTSVVYRTADS